MDTEQDPPGYTIHEAVQRIWPVCGGALLGIVLRLVYSGRPGHAYESMRSSFVLLVPLAVGAVAVYLAERVRRRGWWRYALIGAGANALFVFGTFFVLIEGMICVVLALPLFCVLGALGGVLMGAICRWTSWRTPATYSVAVLPLLLGGLAPQPVQPQLSTVTRALVVPTTPARIWPHLLTAEHIRPSEVGSAWIYRIGVPLPLAAVTEPSAAGAVRHITMGKGVHFDQLVQASQPNEYIRWAYRFAPDSFPAGALDDHVRVGGAYFDVIDAEYALRDVAGGTEIRVVMRYRVSTAFNWYAGTVARVLVGDFEEATLRFFATRALDAA